MLRLVDKSVKKSYNIGDKAKKAPRMRRQERCEKYEKALP